MPLILKPASVIKADLGIQNGGKVHAFFTATCAKAMDPFVPFASGTMATNAKPGSKEHTHLANTVIVNGQPTANVTTDTITYDTPYARYQYYGMREDGSHKINEGNRDRSMHSQATSYWDKKMWSAKGKDVVRQTQNCLNRGGK